MESRGVMGRRAALLELCPGGRETAARQPLLNRAHGGLAAIVRLCSRGSPGGGHCSGPAFASH